MLRTKDGGIVAVDKEQGFKYFGNDKLDVDYHPNAQYGEQEPFYNKLWRDYGAGKADFDPKQLHDTIKAVEAIPDHEYRANLAKYAEMRSPGDTAKQKEFLDAAVARKQNIRSDFEKFVNTAEEKRTGQKGKFSFEEGFKPHAAPKAEAEEPKAAPKLTVPKPEPVVAPKAPTFKAEHAVAKLPPPPPKAPPAQWKKWAEDSGHGPTLDAHVEEMKVKNTAYQEMGKKLAAATAPKEKAKLVHYMARSLWNWKVAKAKQLAKQAA
jgi:hypothetical protein